MKRTNRRSKSVLVFPLIAIVVIAGGLISLSNSLPAISAIRASSDIGQITVTWEKNQILESSGDVLVTISHQNEIVEQHTCSESPYAYKQGIPGEKYEIVVTDLASQQSYAFERLFIAAESIPALPLLKVETVNLEDPFYTEAIHPDNTWANTITDNDYVSGVYQYYGDDNALIHAGSIKVKVRGNTSQIINEKKSYRLKLSEPFDLLQMGGSYSADEWVLLNSGSNFKTYIGLFIGSEFGLELTPHMQFVNVYLNGDWKGIYALVQPVEQFTFRDVVRQNGYIFENDAFFWNEEVYFKTDNQKDQLGFTLKYPKVRSRSSEPVVWLSQRLQLIEQLLINSNPEALDYLDLHSFAGWTLSRDVLGQADGGGSNMFFYIRDRESDPKLRMGPLWDFDSVRVFENGWSAMHSSEGTFTSYLWSYEEFNQEYVEMWIEKRDVILEEVENHLRRLEDSCVAIDQSRILDATRWGNQMVHTSEIEQVKGEMSESYRNAFWAHEPVYYSIEEINLYSDFFENRVSWIDAEIVALQGSKQY